MSAFVYQSPIELSTKMEQLYKAAAEVKIPKKAFRYHFSKNAEKPTFVCDSEVPLSVNGGDLLLDTFHFHAPSEHVIDRVRHVLELHFVFEDPKENLSVYGLTFRIGEESARIIRDLLTRAKRLTLPKIGDYFTYAGSLTGDEDEDGNINWIVRERALEITEKDLRKLEKLGYLRGARKIQERENRDVVLAADQN